MSTRDLSRGERSIIVSGRTGQLTAETKKSNTGSSGRFPGEPRPGQEFLHLLLFQFQNDEAEIVNKEF
jgi:hypothetical protein